MGQVYRIGDIEQEKVIEQSEFKHKEGTMISDGRKITGMYYYTFIDRNNKSCFGYYYEFDSGIDLNEDLVKI